MSGSGPIYEYQRELAAKLDAALRERDEARDEVAAAFQRGAEAMREKAARACADVAPTYGVPDWMSHACASAVIALPLPEEKP